MLRSIVAVVVGFLTIAVLSFVTGEIVMALLPDAFDAAGRTESVPVLVLTLAYVAVYAIFGCYLAARLAPNRPMRHAMILGMLGLIFNIGGTIAVWDTAPAWYFIVSLALVLPHAWLGGMLRERELARKSGSAPVAASVVAVE